MGGEKSKENISMSSKTAITSTTASHDGTSPRQCTYQNFHLIWIDPAIDLSNEDYQNTFTQLQNIVNDAHMFTQRDECIDFLTTVDDMKAFMIIERTLSQQIIPLIHDIPQLVGVYILCSYKTSHEQWAQTWMKVKGIHTEITPICESLQYVLKQNNQDSIAVSFVTLEQAALNENLDQLEPSFMYTQLLKEILLEMQHTKQSMNDFITYCRNGKYGSPTSITRFENDYIANSAIWWYTFPSFIYSMLNDALRKLEADTMITMGFFIRDLHHQIEQLYQKQITSYRGKSFVVYRGQGLSTTDFEKLRKAKGGLMSFNNFLSTSKSQDVSLGYAEIVLSKVDTVGILFQMSIHPSVSSAPFAFINEVSYFKTEEEEILFSMHTVFRIGEIKQIDKINPLYQVELTLTSDNDPQLRILTERIRKEAGDGTRWERISKLLLRIGQFNKAEELYTVLLEQAPDEGDKTHYYNQLGIVKMQQGDYEKALWYYKKSLKIKQKTLLQNHPDLAASYNNIGGVYVHTGQYSKALSSYEKSLQIEQKTLPPSYPHLAISYNNIGEVYRNTGEYSKAFSFYEKSLEIRQKTLPSNHPDLAQSYNNIGGVYVIMGEYSKALSFYEKTREICEKTLPSNHPDLAQSYNNIGGVYINMGEYLKALLFYEKTREIFEKTLPSNHSDLAISYSNIGGVYVNMGEHSKALSFYEKTREIFEKSLPSNHSYLATSYNNIGEVYRNMGEYSKALSFYEKALEILQKTLPSNHPHLAPSYNNIGIVYRKMGEYSKALSFYEKSLEIRQKTLPSNHPDLAQSYNNIGGVYVIMGEYSKALSFNEKSLEIRQKTLPPNHPSLATSYNNIAWVFSGMKNYSKALSYFQRALNIYQRSLPSNHPTTQSVRESIKIVKNKL